MIAALALAAAISGDASSEVARRVVQFAEWWAEGNLDACEHHLHPDYRHVDVAGNQFHLVGWIEQTRNRNVAKYKIETHDLDVRVYGDVAIVTGRNRFWPVQRDPAKFGQELLFTQVWMRSGGSWLRWLYQATPVR